MLFRSTPLWNASAPVSVPHFVNAVFSFRNIGGALGPLPRYQSYKGLSTNIGQAYMGFVREENPNAGKAKVGGPPNWPKYSLGAPTNMVLDSNGSFVGADTLGGGGLGLRLLTRF